MDFFISLNENYLMPAGVLMKSLFENNKGEEVNVYLCLGNGKAGFWQPLCNLGEEYNQQIHLYHIHDYISSDNIKGIDTQRYPLEAYSRLFMTIFLPKNLHKIIYLDCDMVICENLHSLWEENIDGYALGVVTDYQNDNPNIYKRLGYDAKYGYFNSGMLLINLDYWRNNEVVPLFLDYIRKHPDILDFADQDVLNPLFFDKKKVLPIRFNLNTAFLFKKNYLLISSEYYKEIEEAFRHPAIIHYTTDRPWFTGSPNPMLHYWQRYRDMTIWKGQTMKKKKQTFRGCVMRMLVYAKRIVKFGSLSVYDKKYECANAGY